MSKIYKAFDRIKIDKDLKNRTYQLLTRKHKKENSIKGRNFMYASMALATLVLTIVIYNYDNIYSPFKGLNQYQENITTLDNVEEKIIYFNDNIYVLDDIIIEQYLLDYQINTIDVLTNDLVGSETSITSHNEDGIVIYAIKGIDNYEKIAIIKDNKIVVYKIVEK